MARNTTTDLITLNGNKYFKSKDIKIFPSSFRGDFKAGNNVGSIEIAFDPEARLNTEANFILPGTTLDKDTYIINYYNSTTDLVDKITFVLGGYYFEILNVSEYLEKLADKYVAIKFREITLQDPELCQEILARDTERKTKLLDSWEEGLTGEILDYEKITDTGSGSKYEYCFTGLRVLDDANSDEGYEAAIQLFIRTKDGKIILNQERLLPSIIHGTGENTLIHGEGLAAAYKNQTAIGMYNANKENSIFEVGSGTYSARKNALTIELESSSESSPSKTTINTAKTVITGDTSIEKSLAVTNIITSKQTEEVVADAEKNEIPVSPATVTTKSYVDQQDEKYYERVTNDIADLDVAQIGDNTTYIQYISEEGGKISAQTKNFASEISDTNKNDTSTAPSIKAVEVRVAEAEEKASTAIASLNLDPAEGGILNGYVKEISQTDGQVQVVVEEFDQTGLETARINPQMPPSENRTPSSKAVLEYVQNYVTDSISKIWKTDSVKRSLDSDKIKSQTLQSLILNTVYPVGSIYTWCLTASEATPPTACPIQNLLGGKWVKIQTGKFLCAAGETTAMLNNETISYKVSVGTGLNDAFNDINPAGSPHGTLIKHRHTGSTVNLNWDEKYVTDSGKTIITTETGGHSHTIKANIATSEWDFPWSDLEGIYGAEGAEGLAWTSSFTDAEMNGDHIHKFPAPTTSLVVVEEGVDAKNANLPPYVAVLMWRRIE